ncbi:MAG: C10 family peptidase [Bacteroidaceae bacterium]|nr:C10 family peptidase [Bacteroidaceae bacterium]
MKTIYNWTRLNWRILLLLLMFNSQCSMFNGLMAWADDISEQQARQIAAQAISGFHGPEGKGAKAAKQVQPTLAYTMQQEGQKAELYVFNCSAEGNDGFVVVAGDDRVTSPVIGYSEKGHFCYDEAPCNLKALLSQYSREISYLRSHPEIGAHAVRRTEGIGNVVVGPLVKTQWDQGQPYNDMCPKINPDLDQHTLTGCGATALTQVMAYWKYPYKGRGKVSYYWNPTPTSQFDHSADFNNSVYDWDNMLNTYSGGYTEEQVNAVAQLMSDAGAALKTAYGYNSIIGSSSGFGAMAPALVKYFDYNPDSLYTAYRSMAVSEEGKDGFNERIKKELDKKRPCILATTIHFLVVDGYTDEDYFHVNVGWGGESDGYYKLTTVPTESAYWIDQQYLMGICPSYSFKQGENYYYTADDVAVLSFSEAQGNYEIPTSVEKDGKTYPITSVANMAFYENEDVKEVTVPSSVTRIGYKTFYNSSLTNVSLPSTLTEMGEYAFARSSLTEIEVPASIERVPDYAFYRCDKLSSATIFSKEVGVMSFARCNKPEVYFYGESLDDGAFYYNGLSYINLGKVKHIGNDCMSHSGLDDISLDNIETMGWNPGLVKPGGTIYIGKNAPLQSLRYTAPLLHQTNIVVDGNNPNFVSINNAVYSKDLKTLIHFGQKDNRISEGSGIYEYRTELAIPESVERINDFAINVQHIRKLTIPSSVKEIGVNNFTDGVEIYNYATTPQTIGLLDESYFEGCTMKDDLIDVGAQSYGITELELERLLTTTNTGTLHVPAGCKEAYASAAVWKNFATIVDDLPAPGGSTGEASANGVRIVANVQKLLVYPPTMYAYEFLFSSHPTLTYERGDYSAINAVITSDDIDIYTGDLFYKDGQVKITNMSLQKMEFLYDQDPDGIDTVQKDGIPTVRFTVNGNSIYVSGLTAGDSVSLFTTDGKTVATDKANTEGFAKIGLPKGKTTYILRAGETSFKLRIKK